MKKTKQKRELISRAEYARRKGWSRSAVTQFVQKFNIPIFNGKIDPEIANWIIKENLDPAYPRRGKELDRKAR